ncbi:class I adenylate-forming enzyme family protein [Actinocorallia sp. A-T 12471]|uniref:class I adenylate-forming enzyme family protein n=1 Tax=Actinocorallia sp. A-T 12471 TaxID=3089813 RepID=UPI0029CB1C4B|nr:AMP-binding protein [Actinocorallia sp. A-T 12471]MDX6739444.1 AMP-binding protein [Actinocorallia sp. A-T 12471]
MTANLSRMLDWARHRFADRDALIFEDRRWTYAELDRDVNALAAALLARGIGRGDRVAVLAMNLPEYLILGLALAKTGAVMVPLNHRLHLEELADVLERSGAVGLAAEEEFGETARALAARIPRLRVLLAFDPMGEGWQSVSALIAEHQGARVPDADLGPDDLQRILFTSGTTSRPKGVRLTHGNVAANIHAQIVELGLTQRDRVLNFAPLYHVGGLDIPGYATFHVGATMVLMRRFDAASILRAIERERITGMVMVATMLQLIRRLGPDALGDTGSVRWMIFSQVTPALFRDTLALFPNAALVEGYGMTETCNGVTYLDMAHMLTKQGSVGRPVHGVDVRVVDERGAEVAPGVEGEIVVRGPKVCAGYLDDPAADAAAFRDGWFHTGDVGRFDADGYLYVVDRLKDMIRSGGENVAGPEIEAVLCDFPGVHQAAVVGIAHPTWVEVPAAVLVAEPGLDPAALIAHCGARLGRFKVPKVLYVVDELPSNPSGKILKRELRTGLAQLKPLWVAEGASAPR